MFHRNYIIEFNIKRPVSFDFAKSLNHKNLIINNLTES